MGRLAPALHPLSLVPISFPHRSLALIPHTGRPAFSAYQELHKHKPQRKDISPWALPKCPFSQHSGPSRGSAASTVTGQSEVFDRKHQTGRPHFLFHHCRRPLAFVHVRRTTLRRSLCEHGKTCRTVTSAATARSRAPRV